MEAGKSLNGRGKKSGDEKSRTKIFSFLTFHRPIFFLARLDFFPPPLTAPGSPRMGVRSPITATHFVPAKRPHIFLFENPVNAEPAITF